MYACVQFESAEARPRARHLLDTITAHISARVKRNQGHKKDAHKVSLGLVMRGIIRLFESGECGGRNAAEVAGSLLK